MTGAIGRACAALGLLALSAAAAPAQDMRQVYDVSIAGIPAGTATLAVNTEGERYTAEAQIRAGGLIGALFDFRFRGQASGRKVGNFALQPVSYSARRVTGRKEQSYGVSYSGGVPVAAELVPPTEYPQYAIEPRSMAGSLDPVSAAWTFLRDAPAGEACGRSATVYDGSRSFQVTLQARRQAGDLWVCNGAYTREGGFSPRKLAEQKVFPFTVYFRERDGIMRLARLEVATTFGTARATRR
ncbi:DUF3108 domain-containing protein [Rhodobacteraceae bacterium 2CG4]|uniref:DUF3108 domain-containing protein n=1 Tax=Halovulum marinum TaxID=2662447 RepID=A0A6L5YZM6_9RHOB|nr:DUF3108 domain-containing protein [Halovulum marinum]MSU89743.1 DUF3108 domain-containing protein [Halovulum marinum]